MSYSTVQVLICLISCVNALQSFIMYVHSNHHLNHEQNLQFLYEGEWGSYVFLTAGSPPVLIYDEENMNIFFQNDDNYQQLYINDTFVTFTTKLVNSQNFTFIDNKLAVDGETDKFYVCSNTNDPKDYSQVTKELMFYEDNVPQDCTSVNLMRNYIVPMSSDSSSSIKLHSSTMSSSILSSSTMSSSILSSSTTASLLSSSSSFSTKSPISSQNHPSTTSITTSSTSTSVSVIPTQTNNIAAGENIPQLPIIGFFIAVYAAMI